MVTEKKKKDKGGRDPNLFNMDVRVGGEQVYKDSQGRIKKVEDVAFNKLGGNTAEEVQARNQAESAQERAKIADFRTYGRGAEEKKEIIAMSRDLGIGKNQPEPVKPESIEVVTEGQELNAETEQEELRRIFEEEEKKSTLNKAFFGRSVVQNKDGTYSRLLTGTAPIGIPAGVTSAGGSFRIGSAVSSVPSKVVKLGNAAKNSSIISKIVKNPLQWGVAVYASVKSFESFVSWLSKEGRIESQQQALNTIGQMATTIGGQAVEGAGDWKQGLTELDYLYSEVEQLSYLIQQGKIASATIKYNGKIYDITADIEDQLRTIDEQRTIIRSFVLTNSFPEMSELEIQDYLRELEGGGFIEPVDITEERRNTSQI